LFAVCPSCPEQPPGDTTACQWCRLKAIHAWRLR